MKSYNHIWENFISDDNINLAIHNATKGKRNKSKFRDMYEHPEKYYEEMRDYVTDYTNITHIPVMIYDGISRKKRLIIVPDYKEQVFHHMIVNVLSPIFMKGMYEHSNGSIPGRGAHRAKRFVERWVQTDIVGTKYCLKMDISKYFNSISHDILISKFRKLIHDDKFFNLLVQLVYVMNDVSEYTRLEKLSNPSSDIQVIEYG